MNMIRNKLREKSGVSIFMGLLFLIVCLFVGAVVLTASTAAAGKLAEQREREQDYLNVASAARLVKERICKLTYTYTITDGISTSTLSDNGVILGKELEALCKSLVEDPEAALATEKTFEIKLSSAPDPPAVEWDPVYGSLSVEADGRIIVGLWLGNQEKDNAENHNHMEIEFCPDGPVKKTEVSTEDSPAGMTTKTSTTTTYSWPESGCTITKGKQ